MFSSTTDQRAILHECPLHAATLRNGVCPCVEGCGYVSATPTVVEDGVTWTRCLSRQGVYSWKVIRSKGRCLPCEAARKLAQARPEHDSA